MVLTPSFLPRFSASVDYWQIAVKGAIETIQSQQIFDLCYEGLKQFCSFITPNPSTLTAAPASYVITNSPVNLAAQNASGIDFEANYRFDLGDIISGLPGHLDLRYLGTHYIHNVTDYEVSPPWIRWARRSPDGTTISP